MVLLMGLFNEWLETITPKFENVMDEQSQFRRDITELFAEDQLKHQSKILFKGEKTIPLNWDKFRIELIGSNRYTRYRRDRRPRKIVTHWDATLSAAHCVRIFKRKKASTHFIIDNDGTIIQLVDVNNKAWHARKHNRYTIGIDFSNAFYEKYQKNYVKMGHGKRPVITSYVHNKKMDHLGYYPVKLEAYAKLVEALTDHFEIDLKCPLKDGKLKTTKDNSACLNKYNGVVCHYHLTTNKIDCAGLELDKILEEIKKGKE